MSQPKRVAAVVTVYRRHSHADVIVGKILEGFLYDGGAGPDLRVASMYVDQFPENDMSRALARRFGFPIFPNIADALTLGTGRLAVDGVLSIGEHGDYPTNDAGQLLYPRRRFFTEIAAVLERAGRPVPVFNDKHLSAEWADALWVYDRARRLHIPLLAGSSLPLTWRRPALDLPHDAPLTEAVQVGYGPLEGYGFHALEALQCLAECRRGGESGVRSVQFLAGREMWAALDRGLWSRELLESALDLMPAHADGDYRELTARADSAGVILVQYRDGFRAAVAMMNGYAHEGDGGAFCFAGRLSGQREPARTHFYLQQPDPFGHFIYQVKAIEATVQTGHAVYPAERTLLTTGILDAGMRSRHRRGAPLATPHLDVRYRPTGWPFATDPVPRPVERRFPPG